MPEQRPVLIVDLMNLFVRSWSAYPSMSAHGYQMGGCVGTLKTLRRIVNEFQPSAIYVAWEGGGSTRRRALYPDYKMKSRPEKLNRFYEDDIPETDENRKHQLIALLGMAKCIPACHVYVSDCEGDDIVAYLCCGPLRGKQKIIVSSDKDMYQLMDDATRVYSLHKKVCLNAGDVLAEFRVTSQNFAIAKALCGDPSDNIPGVKGVGFKTVAKMYPLLGTDQTVLLQDIISFSHTHVDESKVYRRVVDAEADVRRNWKLVFLDGSMLSYSQSSKVDQVLGTFQPCVDKMGLIRLLVKEGINDFDVEGFFYPFHCIDGLTYKTAS